MSPARLAVDAVDVVVETAWMVREVSLRLDDGETLALLGGPGAGKTALLEALAGRRQASRGSVLLDGQIVDGLGPRERLDLGLALAGQRPALFRGMTVKQHLELGRVARRGAATARTLVMHLLPELAGDLRLKVEKLGRERARLLDIGRAMMSAPSVLLLDEPSLDIGAERLAQLLTALGDAGVAVLVAERFPFPALRVATRACLMISGRIVAEGPSARIAEDDRLAAACMGELAL